MRSKEKIAEEIVLIRYYNVLFYLFFKTGMDDFKRQCLIKKINLWNLYSYCRFKIERQ